MNYDRSVLISWLNIILAQLCYFLDDIKPYLINKPMNSSNKLLIINHIEIVKNKFFNSPSKKHSS